MRSTEKRNLTKSVGSSFDYELVKIDIEFTKK